MGIDGQARVTMTIAAIALAGTSAIALSGCARRTTTAPPTPDPEGLGPSPSLSPRPGPSPSPRQPAERPLRIAQLNAHNFFDTVDQPRVQDDVPTAAQYETKLAKLGLAIRDAMQGPDIIALAEVENERVLADLAARPELRELGYRPVIVEGSDPRGIDVAYLYRPGRVELVSSEQRNATFVSPTGRNIRLFTRPPLVATFRPHGTGGPEDARGGSDITLIANHFTSKLQGEDGARKRLLQAAFVSSLADGSAGVANLDPARVVVLGDFNEGLGEPAYQALVGSGRATGPNLVNAADRLPEADRYSYRSGRTRTLLDHMLLTPTLDARVGAVRIPHINSDPSERLATDPTTPQRVSDHDPVIIDLAA